MTSIERAVCQAPGCHALALVSADGCFAHASGVDRERVLEETRLIDLRGSLVTAESLEWLFDHAELPSEPDLPLPRSRYRALLPEVSFRDAIFGDEVSFDWIAFGLLADFRGARFQDVSFVHAAFLDGATFAGSSFEGTARFDNALFGVHEAAWDASGHRLYFGESARFDGAHAAHGMSLDGARFSGPVGFRDVRTSEDLSLRGAAFEVAANFSGAELEGVLAVSNTTCDGTFRLDGAIVNEADIDGLTCSGALSLRRTHFEGSAALRRLTGRSVDFTGAVFEREATIAVAADGGAVTLAAVRLTGAADLDVMAHTVDCASARISESADLRVRCHELRLDALAPAGPTAIRGATPQHEPAPRISSVRAANLSNVTFAGVDLRHCRLSAAYNLNELRMERDVLLPRSPQGMRWTARTVIAEEQHWRISIGARGWVYSPPGHATPQPAESLLVAWTVRTLNAARDRLELRHRVDFTQDALDVAAFATAHYFSDDALPRRAFDALERAAAAHRARRLTLPSEVEARSRELENALARARELKEQAIEAQQFEEAVRYRDDERRAQVARRELIDSAWSAIEHAVPDDLPRPLVDGEDVAAIIAEWTGHDQASVVEVVSASPTPRPRAAAPPIADVRQPAEIAEVYRSLRRGREANKDAPGAADFYYGEMEMRRHARRSAERGSPGTGSRGERSILALYWLASGYGLRASRALACLVATILIGGWLLARFGFPAKPAHESPYLFAVESTISLLRPPQVALTTTGELVSIVLRLLGPLFFGLTLLAIRGRVKR